MNAAGSVLSGACLGQTMYINQKLRGFHHCSRRVITPNCAAKCVSVWPDTETVGPPSRTGSATFGFVTELKGCPCVSVLVIPRDVCIPQTIWRRNR